MSIIIISRNMRAESPLVARSMPPMEAVETVVPAVLPTDMTEGVRSGAIGSAWGATGMGSCGLAAGDGDGLGEAMSMPAPPVIAVIALSSRALCTARSLIIKVLISVLLEVLG
jgi:hypothetical protein